MRSVGPACRRAFSLGLGFRGSGSRGLGLRVLGFRGLGFRVSIQVYWVADCRVDRMFLRADRRPASKFWMVRATLPSSRSWIKTFDGIPACSTKNGSE